MGKYTTGTRVWVGIVTVAAATLTALNLRSLEVDSPTWLALAILGGCAAVAHLFPIRSGDNAAAYPMTNIFVMAGAIILPAQLVPLLPIMAVTPESWQGRHKPGTFIRWLFNVAQTTVAAYATRAMVQGGGIYQLHDVRDLVVVLGATALFILTQALLVGVIIALNSRIPLQRTGTFALPALLSEGLKAVLAITVAGLWLAEPVLLLVVPALLVIAHRMTRTAHLAYLADLDPKTGLRNSRHFERALEEELAYSLRVGRPLSILLADLDHFKRVNDKHGHAAGDRVLREVATLLGTSLRKSDVIARFGGEEFVALLPHTDAQEAIYLAERLREAVANHYFDLDDGTTLRCTISVGVATSPENGQDASTLVGRADAAMYQAKHTRNSVACAMTIQPSVAEPEPPIDSAAVDATPRPSRFTSAVLFSTALGGMAMAVWSLWAASDPEVWGMLLPFLALAAFAEMLEVRVYETSRGKMVFSFTIAVTMAAVVVRPETAPLVSLVAAVVHAVRYRPRQFDRALFNLANPVMAAGLASGAYVLMRGLSSDPDGTFARVAAAVAAVLVFYVGNFGVVSLMLGLHTGRSLVAVLRESVWYGPTKLCLGLTGAFIGSTHTQFGWMGALVFTVPVVIMRFTLSYYASRSQRSIATLQALNKQLTIEIDNRKRVEQHLQLETERWAIQATRDSLTELASRNLLYERVQSVLDTGGHERPTALLVLDVDRFKDVNDTFGHECGDLVLQQMSRRLQSVVRSEHTVARLGGDEFAVLVPRADANDARALAQQLIEACREPLVIEGCELFLGASVGIALGPLHGSSAATLMRCAEVAMYVAKREQRGCAVYHSDHDPYSPDRLVLIGQLRRGIEHGELVLHYQPKVAPGTGRVDSVEALVRWQHPARGLVAPEHFISLAEHTGLSGPLTRWVLDTALRQWHVWREAGWQVPIAVNVSAQDLNDEQFPQRVADLLTRSQVAPEYLQLEITEGVMMADPPRAIDVLARLRALGLRVAVDDFGTGYSSLAYLSRLPVDELKIDRSFVQGMAHEAGQEAIVRSTIRLGHDLGLSVVAEGVEERSTWDALGRMGVDLAQGFFVSRPLPANELDQWLRNSQWVLDQPRLAA